MHTFPSVTLDLDFLDGFLAGDGALVLPRSRNYVHTKLNSSKLTYVEYVKRRLEVLGLVCRLCECHYKSSGGYSRQGGYTHYMVRTRSHPILTEQFHRWYPSGHKLFPPDFRLSPDSLLQWYLGDGTLSYGKFPVLAFCPDQIQWLDELMRQLRSMFGTVNVHNHTGIVKNLYFGSGAAQRFFEYIGPCPVPEYSYRWPKQ